MNIGAGADNEQTAFLDNRPQSGLITYAVVAVDFHNNRTEAAKISVTIPQDLYVDISFSAYQVSVPPLPTKE